MLVTEFAGQWLARRTRLGHRDVAHDGARLRIHLLPHIGGMDLGEVRPAMVRRLVLGLRESGLSPRTVRNVSAVGSCLFREAVAEELIPHSPWVLGMGVLPKPRDKDPGWRRTARFTRAEAELLCYSHRIPWPRRVVTSLLYMAGLRRGEANRLTIADYERDARPLGRLFLRDTKTGVPREVPVHPALAAILGAWLLSGWRESVGRPPRLADYLVPTRTGRRRHGSDDQHEFVRDCERVGIRPRRGHDLRRTFVSECRSHGANVSVLRTVTHGVSASDAVMDMYTTFTYAEQCAAVSCLEVSPPPTGKVVALRA